MSIYIAEKTPRRGYRLHKFLQPAIRQSQSINWWERLHPEDRRITGKAYHRIKRVFDFTCIVLALPLLLPLLMACALLIKLEAPREPVFFQQRRTGKDGRRFGMLKFRTMVPDAESIKQDLRHLNELPWPDFKIKNDPRITKSGHFLRKTSLDELPQIVNVLWGDMSIVGPRPTSFAPETYSLWQTARLDVLPGITGIWQIEGRGSMTFDERVALDIAYIERQSLTLDFMIILHTVNAVFHRRGAM